MKNKDIFRN